MVTRRTLIGAVGTAGLVGFAGCNGGNSDGSETEPGAAENEQGTAENESEDQSATGAWRAADGGARNTSANTVSAGPTDEPSTATLWEPEDSPRIHRPLVVEDGQLFAVSQETLFSISANGEKTWEFGHSTSYMAYNPVPAVRDGTVYLPTGTSLVAVADGKRQWAIALDSTSTYSPVATRDAVYASTGDRVVSVSHDGTEQWTQTLEQDGGRIAVADSTLYQFGTAAFEDPTLNARDTSDGSLQWSKSGNWNDTAPIVADGSVYITRTADSGVQLLSVSGADGTIEWETEPLGAGSDSYLATTTGSVAVADGTAYLLTGNKLQAYDTDDGAPQWESPYIPTVSTERKPRVDSNSVYLFNGSSIVAVDRVEGDQRWSTEIGDSRYPGFQGFCPADDAVYVALQDKILTLS